MHVNIYSTILLQKYVNLDECRREILGKKILPVCHIGQIAGIKLLSSSFTLIR